MTAKIGGSRRLAWILLYSISVVRGCGLFILTAVDAAQQRMPVVGGFACFLSLRCNAATAAAMHPTAARAFIIVLSLRSGV